MAFNGKFESWKVQAKADLSDTTPGIVGALYKAVDFLTGTYANDAAPAIGLLQEGASSGGHINLAIQGVSKAVFATAITSVGMELTVVTSGLIGLAGSGDYVVGKNLTAVDCVAVGAGMFNFLNPWLRTT